MWASGDGRRDRHRKPPAHGPELVFGVVRPVGTSDDEFYTSLSGGLLAYGYEARRIKLSEILADAATARGQAVPTEHEEERIHRLMDEGDKTCRDAEVAAAVALLGVSEIRALRQEHHRIGEEVDERTANVEVPRNAYILDSLKRPAEVLQLRRIYGDHFILISLQASPSTRAARLMAKLKPQRPTADNLPEIVKGLIDRDLNESDDEYGQNTLLAFPMADLFVDVDSDAPGQVTRFLDLMFGSPAYREPTVEEFGMQLAHVSSSRSPELGLKVGAAILNEEKTVISLGVNAHPVPSGSPDFDASALDIKGLVVDTLQHLGGQVLAADALARLDADADEFASELLTGPLKDSRVMDLTEFQLTVHAEMSALLDAIRQGATVSGSTVFVTAFPCHNCAKHLVALGLKVKYLEPYPKSRAGAMYGQSVEATFLPFTGVAPRRYHGLFDVDEKRKNADGSRRDWSASDRLEAQPRVDPLLDQRGIADREKSALNVLPEELIQILASASTPSSGEPVGGSVAPLVHDEDHPEPSVVPDPGDSGR
jgi:deoxycytidylate deaminase